MAKAAEAKLLRTNRIRADTTVVPANVGYPTDSGLLAKAIGVDGATVWSGSRPPGARCVPGCGTGGRRRASARAIAAKLRTRSAAGSDEAQTTVRRITGQLAGMAATTAGEADRLLTNAKQALRRARAKADKLRERGERDAAAGRRRGQLARAVNHLTEWWPRRGEIVAQTRSAWPGHTPDGATRRVSLHDRDARPIAKGRLGQPGRVRAEGPDRRQRRRDRPRS